MKTKILVLNLAMIMILISGCNDNYLYNDPEPDLQLKSSDAKLKIALISDIHYMDHALLPEGPDQNPAFQSLLFSSYNKLIEMSEPIFAKTLSELKVEKPDILLVTGDMANNGERFNHEKVIEKLNDLETSGIIVLVIPGNNDINSPDAMSYAGNAANPVPNISPSEFVSLYGDFGYDDALYRDDHSLSYVFPLSENTWILGIDACIYTPVSKRSATLQTGTMEWISEVMAEANDNNIRVLAMMHHAITEQYSGQSYLNKGDVVNNYVAVSEFLINSGIRIVFTGHTHAHDITRVDMNDQSLYDVGTGSLITPLSPYRIMILDDNFIKIETRRITALESAIPGNSDFCSYSDNYLTGHLDLFFKMYMVNFMQIPPDLADLALPHLRNAIKAQFAGDEKMAPGDRFALEELDTNFPPDNSIVPIIQSFWTDFAPGDEKIHIKLK
jgi:3',5'-cyclic AMP phosphodiesterase CpdA